VPTAATPQSVFTHCGAQSSPLTQSRSQIGSVPASWLFQDGKVMP
jgi:hypothetical protein